MNLCVITNNNNNSANNEHDITEINSDEEYSEEKFKAFKMINSFRIKLFRVQILYLLNFALGNASFYL